MNFGKPSQPSNIQSLVVVVVGICVASSASRAAPKKNNNVKGAPIDPYAPVATPKPVATAGKSANKTIDPYAAFADGTAPLPNPYAGVVANPVTGNSVPPVAGTPKATVPTPAAAAATVSVTDTRNAKSDPFVVPAPASFIPPRIAIADQNAIAGLLAVAHLDGWLLADNGGQNSLAQELVLIDSTQAPTQPWFYLIPQKGQAALVCQVNDCYMFAVPGTQWLSRFTVGAKRNSQRQNYARC
jgi:hypothetical protein